MKCLLLNQLDFFMWSRCAHVILIDLEEKVSVFFVSEVKRKSRTVGLRWTTSLGKVEGECLSESKCLGYNVSVGVECASLEDRVTDFEVRREQSET